jgi:DNA end-binding protein Ku
MPPHSIGSGTISFGLVSIPIRMFTAASSKSVSFNQLHPKCGGRIKQQLLCPTCNEVVERNTLVKGYEFAKDQYVQFTEDEIKALEGEASKMIDIAEFVPLSLVDPIYFESSYYLGPDKGGEKAYRLLAEAMEKTGRVALAKFVMRGKENLVLIRPTGKGLMLHTMYYADEVRDFGEIDKGDDVQDQAGEMDLAERLIDELSQGRFRPSSTRTSTARACWRGGAEGGGPGDHVARAAGAAHAGDRSDGGAEAEPRQPGLKQGRGSERAWREAGEEAGGQGTGEGRGPAREESVGRQALIAVA